MGKKAPNAQAVETLVAGALSIGASAEEARTIHSVVEKHKLPADIDNFEIRFGRDADGDAAVWVIFAVNEDNTPSREKINQLNQFGDAVRSDLLKANLRYWPYINFRALPQSQRREPA